MNNISGSDCQQNKPDSQKVHGQAIFLERVEESRTDLKAYREHKKNESEILYERQHRGIDPHAEMAEQYSHKKNPRRPKGYTFKLETTQIQT